ncbi:hypothetical protein Pla144_13280 [Bythopirellula polymerisocia]|uniref:Uncharacterized protein n=1 Tax=Bythopirellula polymerisocia TaxID=2528003 RepID=A0A5C6D0Y5_9BACT|nr:hypothetical protein Pla144_13280 [Bythopirellula polymerisocia]
MRIVRFERLPQFTQGIIKRRQIREYGRPNRRHVLVAQLDRVSTSEDISIAQR